MDATLSGAGGRFLDDLKRLSVLYVEDDEAVRMELAHFLERRVGRLYLAADGQEGVSLFATHRPDLVITDIEMPVMDGLALARDIKTANPATPVIIATVLNDVQYLQEAVAAGVDGYVLKPIDLEQLLETLARSVDHLITARALEASRAQLEAYHRADQEERHLVAELMTHMMRPESLHDPLVSYWLRPSQTVGGDLIAVARTRHQELYVLLADSTGHGLPAALNLLPINHIFHRMVSKSLPVALIVEEMNWAVKEQSPVERFVAALVMRLDVRNRIVEVWNGGIPAALYLDDAGRVVHRFEVANVPLGVLDRTFNAETEVYQWQVPGQLLVYSDGLEDMEDETGRPFGEANILAALGAARPPERYEALRGAACAYLGERNAFDDMTFLLVASRLPEESARQTAGGVVEFPSRRGRRPALALAGG